MKRSIVLLIAAAVLFSCGYRTRLGPAFAHATAPEGKALVYLYRPSHGIAWMRPVHTVVDGQERLVMINGYAVVALPPGKHDLHVYSTGSTQNYVSYGFGGTRWAGKASLDLQPGSTHYVKLVARIGVTEALVVSESQAREEIADLQLTPGGALRP